MNTEQLLRFRLNEVATLIAACNDPQKLHDLECHRARLKLQLQEDNTMAIITGTGGNYRVIIMADGTIIHRTRSYSDAAAYRDRYNQKG